MLAHRLGVLCYLLEQAVQLGQVESVPVHLGLHQVVADWTGLTVGLARPRPGPGVLPAPVTPPTLHLAPGTPALASQLVTGHARAPPAVTVTRAAAGGGEPVMVGHADIAPVTRDTRPALTPARPEVTRLMEGSYRVTVAGVTAGATVNVPVSVPAPVTPLPLHIAPAHALARLCVTLPLLSGPGLVALAGQAAHAPGHRVPPEARAAQLAPLPGRVADALEARPRHGVTVAGAGQVDVPVTLALDTRPGRAAQTLGVAVIAVHASLTPGPRPPRWTLGAGDRGPGQVTPAQSGGAAILGHLGARARLAVIWRGGTCVTIVSISARVTRVPHCVVGAVTHAGVHLTVVRVAVTVARDTFACRLVMVVSRLTCLAVLTLVPHGTLTLFNPLSRLTSCPGLKQSFYDPNVNFDHLIYQCSFELDSVDESLAGRKVSSPDPEGRHVAQDPHELRRGELGPPAQAPVLVKSELK